MTFQDLCQERIKISRIKINKYTRAMTRENFFLCQERIWAGHTGKVLNWRMVSSCFNARYVCSSV